jgi:single-strand DNA-binding protein
MAFTLNRVELLGHLGREADLRYTPDGQPVAHLRLATDRPVRPGAAAETDWHALVCWGKLAELAGQYARKGRLVYVAGRLTYRAWDGQDGQARRSTEIVVSELLLLDRRPEPGTDTLDAEADDAVPF